ncbi:MAG: hypothetical protein ABSH47_27645 [Bryobacteraceae bacterium]
MILSRIMSIPEDRVGLLLEEVSAEFSQRHQQIRNLFLERFEQVREMLLTEEGLSEERRLLIGSYFLAEYSLESAALFNPSTAEPRLSPVPRGAASCGAVSVSACLLTARAVVEIIRLGVR